jgi:hypothetical protein
MTQMLVERVIRTALREIDREVEVEALARRQRPARRGVVRTRPEVSAGFLPRHLPHVRALLGRPLTSPGIARLGAVWRATANPGETATLTLANSRPRFNLHRRRFWTAVRRDPAAARLFTDAGFRFGPRAGSAPYRVLASGRRMTVTIDHIVERQTAPRRALEPSNLRMSSRLENTVLLRQLTERNRRFHGV